MTQVHLSPPPSHRLAPSRRAVLISALGAGLAACGPKSATTGGPIRIGTQRGGVLLIAKSRGLSASELAGTASGVEWIEFPSGPPMIEALAAGALDLGLMGESPPIFAQAAGAGIVYAAVQPVTGASQAIITPKGSAITNLAELRGKKVAFTKGSASHLFTIVALRSAGLTLTDVQATHLAPGEAMAAFSAGAIDAWAVWDPFYALALAQGGRELTTADGLFETNAFYVASRRFAEERPEALRALLDALAAQAAWGNAHRDAYGDLFAKATGLPPAIAQTMQRRGSLAVDPVAEPVLALQQEAADIFLEAGALPAAVKVREAAWTGWQPR